MRSFARWLCWIVPIALVVAAQVVTPAAIGAPSGSKAPHLPAPRVHGKIPKNLPVAPTQRALPKHSKEAKRIAYDRKHLDPFETKPAPRLPVPKGVAAARRRIDRLRSAGQLPQTIKAPSAAYAHPIPFADLPIAGADDDATASSAVATAPATMVAAAATAPKACAGEVYCASYALGGTIVAPNYETYGTESVTITNWGTKAWPAGKFFLDYHLYTSDDSPISSVGAPITTLPAVAANGGSVSVDNAEIQFLGAGSYKIAWDIWYPTADGTYGWFSQIPSSGNQNAVPASAVKSFTVDHHAPRGEYANPSLTGGTIDTLTPTLIAEVHDDGTQAIHVQMRLCPVPPPNMTTTTPSTCDSSAWIAATADGPFAHLASWTVPAGDLYWDTQYQWQIRIEDGSTAGAWNSTDSALVFTTVVTQPAQAQLGSSPAYLDDQGVNMYLGQYVDSEQDAVLPAGPDTLAVTRTYNSADTTDRSFGVGWSSVLDAKWVDNADGSFTITLPDGSERRYAKNPDGAWAGGWGFPVIDQVFPASRTITINGTTYTFDSTTGELTSLASRGRQVLTMQSNGRGLTEIEDPRTSRVIHVTRIGNHVTQEQLGEGDDDPLDWTFLVQQRRHAGARVRSEHQHQRHV